MNVDIISYKNIIKVSKGLKGFWYVKLNECTRGAFVEKEDAIDFGHLMLNKIEDCKLIIQ